MPFSWKRAWRPKFFKFGLTGLVVMQLVILTALPVSAAGSGDYSFASGAFRKVWERPDLPVAVQKVQRGFTWGPEGFAFLDEPYAETPGGKRLVQYFDKTRMEITNPAADSNGAYYVTNGLLVKEMVAGQVQLGDNKFENKVSSEIPVAGDPVGNPSPTYRSFKAVATLNGDNKATQQTGNQVKTVIDQAGKVSQSDDLANKYQVKYTQFNAELGHNIPEPLWNFLNQQGTVYQNNNYSNGLVFDWIATMGFPITEAYWSQAVIGGNKKDVLIQLFERRVLTYTPDNEAAYKVEMGNVGQHYYKWRYPGQASVAPYANFKITNNSSCNPVSLSMSGQDNFTTEIGTNATKTLKLGPGTYNYKATGCGYVPLEKSISLKANEVYSFELVVN